jgi:phosphatidate cytidylyltransferase
VRGSSRYPGGGRVLTAIVLAAIGIPAIYFGGIWFFTPFSLLLCVAAWEFTRLFWAMDIQASGPVAVLGVFFILVSRAFFVEYAAAILALSVAAAMVFHLIEYERGRDRAATDFAATAAGIVYLGWIGAYLFDLRALPAGAWWFLLVLGPVWVADSAAYYVGRAYGRHKMVPRLSPKKSWEGYIASAVGGMLGGLGLAAAFGAARVLSVPLWQAALLGLLMGTLPTLGDLGESMIKRQSGMKDSGALMPGHGGAFDRIDSWLWSGLAGFLVISLLFLQ